MSSNTQNKQTPFVCDKIMKKALIIASKRMNTSQSKVIQLALSQFLRDIIFEELNNTCPNEKPKSISNKSLPFVPLGKGESYSQPKSYTNL